MFFSRIKYLRFMTDKVCRFHLRSGNNVAQVTVLKVLLRKTRTERHITEHHKNKGDETKVDTKVESKEIVTEVEAYQIIAENKADGANKIEKVV